MQTQLSVRRGRAAVEFYKLAFGAVEAYRFGGIDGHEEVVAQLRVGDSCFWVEDESPGHHNFSPESLGGSSMRMLLIVEDPDATVGGRSRPARRRSRRCTRHTAGALAGSRTRSGTTGRSAGHSGRGRRPEPHRNELGPTPGWSIPRGQAQ